ERTHHGERAHEQRIMKPASWPREDRSSERLLLIDPVAKTFADGRVVDLARHIRAGDVVVVNDAATLPGSLRGQTATGEELELRLLGPARGRTGGWQAVLFGAGDWRTPTELRPAPPSVCELDVLSFGHDLTGTIEQVSSVSRRLVVIRFDREGAAL